MDIEGLKQDRERLQAEANQIMGALKYIEVKLKEAAEANKPKREAENEHDTSNSKTKSS